MQITLAPLIGVQWDVAGFDQRGKLGEWQSEKRNVREDFKRFFGKEAPSEARGLGILTDGDGTKTQPEAAFDDFVASKK